MPITRSTSTNNSADSDRSRYSQGGDTDQFLQRLGWWERINFTQSDDDVTIVVDSRTARRPDLIAFDLYRLASLQWFVLQFNNIVDVNTEVVSGARLRLPAPSRVFSSILTRPTGGNRVI